MITRETIFVDTSAWVALTDRDDAHHRRAASVFPSLLETAAVLITSNLVVAESYILILHELGHGPAMNFLERIKTSPRISKIFSDADTEAEAEEILAKYADQDFSYADAVSFATMKKMKIVRAFCFYKHFLTAGFQNIPARRRY